MNHFKQYRIPRLAFFGQILGLLEDSSEIFRFRGVVEVKTSAGDSVSDIFEFSRSEIHDIAASVLGVEVWRIMHVQFDNHTAEITWTDRAPKWWERMLGRR